MIHNRFEELKLSGSLPSPSGIGLSILRLTQREDASMEDLLRCLQADPACTGRLLKLAHARRAPSEPAAASVLQAALRLGMRTVRSVALDFTLVTSNRSGVCAPFDYERYWSSSLACAVAAQDLARVIGASPAEEAFTFGLLSRVGMLALASVHPEQYARILIECQGLGLPEVLHAEQRAFGIDQAEATAAIFSDWGLPESFASAIRLRAKHTPLDGETDVEALERAELLDLAGRMATLLTTDRKADPQAFERAWSNFVVLGAKHGLDQPRLEQLAGEIGAHWRQWGELLRVLTPDLHGFPPPREPGSAFGALPELPEEPSSAQVPGAQLEPRVVHAPTRVLVVDDDQKLARLVALHLTRAGYEVTLAADGSQALARVLSDAPQIVVTDWMMPSMTGVELCQALRRTDAGRKTYVLILTAREDEDRIVDAFNAGADDYVTKPFNPRILLARVQAARRLVELQTQVDFDKRIRERQMAEMGLLTRKLRAAALTDVLTELPNRRYAMSRLEQEWAAAVRQDRPLSVILLDIDHFKHVNDQWGHDVGDLVLKSTASILQTFARRGDVVCRWGGEEFLVINVNSDASGALLCAERLRLAVQANEVTHESFRGRITVSLGVAGRRPDIRDVDALLKAADQAVYVAKAAGRNTARLADGPDEVLRSA